MKPAETKTCKRRPGSQSTVDCNDTNLLQGTSGPISLDLRASLSNREVVNDAYDGAVAPTIPLGWPVSTTTTSKRVASDTVASLDGRLCQHHLVRVRRGRRERSVRDRSGPGAILAQAVTDIVALRVPFSGEQFVDGYGTDPLTINGFDFGNRTETRSYSSEQVTGRTGIEV